MAQRRSKRPGAPRRDLPPLPMPERVETGADGHPYQVRPVRGARAVKPYRCPGCDHEIPAGTPHVVVWRSEDADAADRRHWHTPCWSKRANRGPTRRWS